MKRILAIGIGSLIMMDDAIGVRVAEGIQDEMQKLGIRVLAGETDFQYCFDQIRPDDFVIIMDAVTQGASPGSIEILPLCDALRERSKLHTQHEFSLFDAIALHYPQLGGAFIGIQAAEIDYGFELSESLKQRLTQICTTVSDSIKKIKENTEHA